MYQTFFLSLSLSLSAAELSLLLREMILKLFSEHLSADGKVISSSTQGFWATECLPFNATSSWDFTTQPYCTLVCLKRWLNRSHTSDSVFTLPAEHLKKMSVCVVLAPTVCGLQSHVNEPCFWALLWAGHSAAEGGAPFAESRGEAGLLYQHLQRLGHPWVPTPGGPHQHVAKIQSRISQLHFKMLFVVFFTSCGQRGFHFIPFQSSFLISKRMTWP